MIIEFQQNLEFNTIHENTYFYF